MAISDQIIHKIKLLANDVEFHTHVQKLYDHLAPDFQSHFDTQYPNIPSSAEDPANTTINKKLYQLTECSLAVCYDVDDPNTSDAGILAHFSAQELTLDGISICNGLGNKDDIMTRAAYQSATLSTAAIYVGFMLGDKNPRFNPNYIYVPRKIRLKDYMLKTTEHVSVSANTIAGQYFPFSGVPLHKLKGTGYGLGYAAQIEIGSKY